MNGTNTSSPMSETTPSGEMKMKVWQAFSQAVASLHRDNVLRDDIDAVNLAVYDSEHETITFAQSSSHVKRLNCRASADELALNLAPLMQLILSNKATQDPTGVWETFEAIYLGAMDERGPRVIARLREIRDRLQEASELNMKALALGYIGKTDESRSLFKQVLDTRRENGDYEGYCGALCNLALVRADAGDLDDAHSAVDEAIRVAREQGRRKAWSLALFQKGLLYKRQGDQSLARKYADLAMHTWQRTGQPVPEQFVAMAESLRGRDSGTETNN